VLAANSYINPFRSYGGDIDQAILMYYLKLRNWQSMITVNYREEGQVVGWSLDSTTCQYFAHLVSITLVSLC